MYRPTPGSALRLTVLLVALLCAVSACSRSSDGSAPSAASPTRSTQPPAPLRYVALGDSYVSAPLVPVTDIANGCLRSSNNYPTLAAKALGATLDDHSCAGARTEDLTTSQHPDVPPQLSAVKPGVDLVTIGIGGNDGGVFGQFTSRCPQLRAQDPKGAPCEAAMSRGGRDMLLTALDTTRVKVTAALRRVHQLAPQATVLVVGYPQIIAPGDSCSKLPLAAGDYAYAAKVNQAMATMLQRAAEATGSSYVDVFTASKGHGVCSADPWINGSVNDQKRAAAYHPFAVEQKAVAELVVAAAKG